MNTSTTPYTQLESLLLFRGIAQHGLETAAFALIAEALRNNEFIKNASTYDARRLNPEPLQEFFLQLLREELRADGGDRQGPDGVLSPASQTPKDERSLLPTLGDAKKHVGKIEAAHLKLQDAYLRHAVHEIRQLEGRFDVVQGEIAGLEKLGVQVDVESGLRTQGPNGVQDTVVKHEPGKPNGVAPSPLPSPKPGAQIPVSQPPASQQLRPLQPLLPHPAQRQDAGNGPSPPQQAAPERAVPAPLSPALNHPQATRSSQLGQQEIPRPPSTRPSETPKPPNGAAPVLQAPQATHPFQQLPHSPAPPPVAEDLQRPDGLAGPRVASAPPPVTNPPQGQLKWEPPYQPNAPAPRQAVAADAQQHSPAVFSPLPHVLPPHRTPQQQLPPHTAPLPSGRPQISIPPHATSQFAPPLQSPPVRPASDSAGATGPVRQHPLLPGTTNVPQPPQPQSPYHPPPYGYPPPTQEGATPGHPPQGRPRPPPAHPAPGRSPVIPASPVPPATVPPTPGHGLAAPQQQRPQPLNLQAPQSYSPQSVPQAAPSGPVGTDIGRTYNSPYQPPRPTAVDRVHPRLPAAATPTPPARFSPFPAPPRTPPVTFTPRVTAGSGTKWISTSTPSTPRAGVDSRLKYDNVPSPAYEPASPVLQPAKVPPAQKPERHAEPSASKQTSGQPRGQQTATSAAQRASQTKEAPREAEPDQTKVKHEATTPRPSTEAGDTTADESVTGRPQPPRSTKRKREDLTPTPVRALTESRTADERLPPHEAPTVVLWTRSFNKVCGSAMEQIVHHRSANMFAAPIREKDAPGYHRVVKYPQDLKSIRAAINHGNRAAAQAAASLLPDGDPGTSSVWLPRTEELVPPKAIINSSQLDRELAHMFSNAVMYNPDPYHGPGPAFLRDEDEEGEDAGDGGGHGPHHLQDSVLGYKVDEFGVVNDARAMFVEVEKLLSELRSAEIQRGAPPPTGTSTRQASVMGGRDGCENREGSVKGEEGEEGGEQEEEEGLEQSGAENPGGAVKRRRVARG